MQTLKAIVVCSPHALREQLDQVSGKMKLSQRRSRPTIHGTPF